MKKFIKQIIEFNELLEKYEIEIPAWFENDLLGKICKLQGNLFNKNPYDSEKILMEMKLLSQERKILWIKHILNTPFTELVNTIMNWKPS